MEGTPRGLELAEVADAIRSVAGVQDVHHLNIWTVCSHILALSVHIDSDAEFEGERAAVIHSIEHLLAERFHVTHTTIQMDCSSCVNGPVIRELRHDPQSSHDHHH
jgi:cobalt-zinc-cadmium efflux system protein